MGLTLNGSQGIDSSSASSIIISQNESGIKEPAFITILSNKVILIISWNPNRVRLRCLKCDMIYYSHQVLYKLSGTQCEHDSFMSSTPRGK